jgi:uncharacterized SAM-binding protein YcdF (DUF218 family)
MSLGALATAVVVPPLNLLPLGFAGLALSWRWPRFGRLLIAVSLFGLLVFSLPVTSRSLIASLEQGLPRAPPDQPPAAIVILSGDADYGTDAGLETGVGVGALTLERMRAGALMQRRTGLPVLVTGGVLEPGSAPIATLMARSLRDEFGVPVRWIEPASEDTWQNAEFSAALLHAAGINSVYLVSHAWHLRRGAMAFAHFGIATTPAPLRYDRAARFNFDEFMPHASAVLNSYFALHEWIGILYYALRS